MIEIRREAGDPARPNAATGMAGQHRHGRRVFSAGRKRMSDPTPLTAPQVVLTFDVEEHWRIEAASGLSFDADSKAYHAGRVAPATRWLLDELARFGQTATFFLVAHLARQQPDLVRA